MKNPLLQITIFTTTLLFGLGWVEIYQHFFGKFNPPQIEVIQYQDSDWADFDINDPDSVLPVDFEEDKLSDPKEDENNPKYFDPEGRYFLFENPKEFGDIFFLAIQNKNFEVDSDEENFGDLIPPKGFMVLENNEETKDECGMHDYFDIPEIKIKDGKIKFATQKVHGVSYEFLGEFLIRGNFYTLDRDAKVLKGKLSKKKNGKVIAEKSLTFGWDNSDSCFH